MRLIDADALRFPAMKGSFNEIDLSRMDGYRKAIQIIRNAPTIDAYPITRADWVDPYADDMIIAKGMVYQCSNCHASVFKIFSPTMNFCPNCGARMDEKEND